jgi:crotonobetainyl-CoA:carnitine CoA-transferase CaiB-like acyl-CoA transferase
MKTADGHINITAMRDRHYVSLCEVLGLEPLIDDERFNTRDKRVAREAELMPLIRAEFLKRTTEEWAEALTKAEVMNAPIATYDEFMADEQVEAVNAISWVDHPSMAKLPLANIPGLPAFESGAANTKSPHVGQQTVEILSAAGYDDATIKALAEAGAIRVHEG